MHRILLICLLLMNSLVMAQPIDTGGMSIHPREGAAPAIHLADVPVIRGGSMQLYRPDWTEGYYSSASGKPAANVDRAAMRVTLSHTSDQRVQLRAAESWRVVEPNKLEITLAGRVDSDVEVNVEWAVGLINAFALYGGSYSGNGVTIDVVPEAMRFGDDPVVLRDVEEVMLRSRVGSITVRVESGGAKLSLLDGRRDGGRWWTQETPSMWVGFLGVPVKSGQPFELRVSVQFEPAVLLQPTGTITLQPPLIKSSDTFTPQPRDVVLIPKPRSLEWRDGRFDVSDGTAIVIAADGDHRPARVVQREARERFGLDLPIVVGTERQSSTIRFVTVADQMPSEGYGIRVTPDGVELVAAAPVGHFYAAQTLAQLFQADVSGLFIPACEIDDAPSLRFRGVHIFPGRDAMPFHRALVERIFSRFKLNHIVIQSDYTQWETDSNIWIDISVPKAQLREYVEVARENFLEPIPLVMSLGHAEWMFKNDQNLDIAEDPAAKYAYSVTNPLTYEFIKSVYAEALEIFRPRYFHIGHDEVTMRGEYPHREEAKKWGVTKLFLYDVRQLDEFFRPRDVRVMLWGDMLLAREETYDGAAFAENLEEAKRRRDGLPRDAIIFDWHYTPTSPENYTSLRIFRDEGFKTIACTWFNPLNIYTFAAAARMHDAWGLLQTMWAGYSITEKTLRDDFKQFAAYILAAEYAWSGDSPPPDQLPYRVEDVFKRAFKPKREWIQPRAGFVGDLSGAANLRWDEWLGFGEGVNLATLPRDRMDGIDFDVGGAIALHGALMPPTQPLPRTVTVELNRTASHLAMLHVSAFRASPREQVGTYRIRYTDGSEENIPLRYGEEIRAWTDVGVTSDASLAWTGTAANGAPIAVRLLMWENPHPTKPIAAVELAVDHPYASPILLGLAGLDGG